MTQRACEHAYIQKTKTQAQIKKSRSLRFVLANQVLYKKTARFVIADGQGIPKMNYPKKLKVRENARKCYEQNQ